jgi:hypothetical protein
MFLNGKKKVNAISTSKGNGGQKYLWEEQHMVTVITGGNFNTQSSSDELIRKFILPAFNQPDKQ